VINFALNHGVDTYMICLPLYSIHLMQALDVGCSRKLTRGASENQQRHLTTERTSENPTAIMTKAILDGLSILTGQASGDGTKEGD